MDIFFLSKIYNHIIPILPKFRRNSFVNNKVGGNMVKEKINFEDSQTIVNLAKTFAGECQDGARYQFIATLAETEGYAYIQQLLKKLAKNEMAHAQMVYKAIVTHSTRQVHNISLDAGYPFVWGNLLQNLEHSMSVEDSEGRGIYPGYATVARDEGYADIGDLFDMISQVEVCHNKLLKQIIDKMKKKTLYKCATPRKWKCDTCGYEATQKCAWKECPLCGKGQGYVQIPIDTGE